MLAATVRVRYADTDAMGVAYHANYLVWFEVGRTELMRSWGVPYADFEKRGIFVPVVEANVRFLASGRYDDLLQVETSVSELSPARVKFHYRVVRSSDGRLLCEGDTLHGFVSPAGRPMALAKVAPDLYQMLQTKSQEG
ncbi:MAG: acyl-CoA thioesterase [Mycobacterium leprae]